MIPPFLRRCPECGYVGPSRRFASTSGPGSRRVECPRCRARFEPLDDPLLN